MLIQYAACFGKSYYCIYTTEKYFSASTNYTSFVLFMDFITKFGHVWNDMPPYEQGQTKVKRSITKIKKCNCCTYTKETSVESYPNITTLDSTTRASDAC